MDIIPLDVLGVQFDGQHHPFVLLGHDDRVLPMVVGIAEAEAIQSGLMKRDFGRPMTHDLICNVLAGLRGELQSVVIYKLENDIFYAHLNIEQKSNSGAVEQVLRVDSRPSDSIAIAIRIGCPIYVVREVFELTARDYTVQSSDDDQDEDDENEGEGEIEP